MQTRSSLHCVFLPFETFAVFCDCNPSPDPLAPGRIRARMPQRRDFRKKKTSKWVQIPGSPAGSEGPAGKHFSDAKEKSRRDPLPQTQGAGRRKPPSAPQLGLCQAGRRGERSARESMQSLSGIPAMSLLANTSPGDGGALSAWLTGGAGHLRAGRGKAACSADRAGARSSLAPQGIASGSPRLLRPPCHRVQETPQTETGGVPGRKLRPHWAELPGPVASVRLLHGAQSPQQAPLGGWCCTIRSLRKRRPSFQKDI